MRVTSWIGSLEVDDGGKGVISGLESSSVDESDVESSVEVADPVDEVEEEASPSSVVEIDSEGPEIVLTIVVTTFVLVWLPDASEVLIAVMVLTKVVTTSALDWLPDVFEIVVVEVLLDRLLDLKEVELVWLLPLLLLLADAVTPAVVLLWLDAVLVIGVVELLLLEDPPTLVEREGEVDTCDWLELVVEVRVGNKISLPLLEIETPDSEASELDVTGSDEVVLEDADAVLLVPVKVVFEADNAVGEIEIDVFWAGFEVVTCVPEDVPEDTVESEIVELFLPVVCVPVTVVSRVILPEVDTATVLLELDVWITGVVGVLEEEALFWVALTSCDLGVELLPLVLAVPCPFVVCVFPAPSVVDVNELDTPATVAARLLLELELPDCDPLDEAPVEELKKPEPADILPLVCPKLPVSVTVPTVPLTLTAVKVTFPNPPEVVEFPLLLEPAVTAEVFELSGVEDVGLFGIRNHSEWDPVSRLYSVPSMVLSSPAVKGTRWVPTVQSMLELEVVEAAFCAILLLSPRSLASRKTSSTAIGSKSFGDDATARRPWCLLAVILVVVMCVLVTVVELAVRTSKESSRARLHINMKSLQAEGTIVDTPVG
jgi:hypothetical protein